MNLLTAANEPIAVTGICADETTVILQKSGLTMLDRLEFVEDNTI